MLRIIVYGTKIVIKTINSIRIKKFYQVSPNNFLPEIQSLTVINKKRSGY